MSSMKAGAAKLGLALGSGAARGMAHIGVLRALDEADMSPDIVAGTSIGALVGGVYAAGKLDELTDIALGLDWKKAARYFTDVAFPRSGLIEGSRVTDFLAEIVGAQEIAELPIVFRAVATDIMSGQEVVLDDGSLVAAIRASVSVPGIFTPFRRNGSFLVDGGLVDPVPVSVCRALGAERVIAVDINNGRVRDTVLDRKDMQKIGRVAGVDAKEMFGWLERKTNGFDVGFLDPVKEWMTRGPVPGIFDVLGNSLRIMEEQIARTRLKIDRPDLLIQPEVGSVRFMEFFLAGEMIEEGYRAAREAIASGKK